MKAKKIVITGAESTGKSTLTKELAQHYNTNYLNEYSRKYVEELNRQYNYDDVVFITRKQIELEEQATANSKNIFFVDTSLIVLKVWFEVVYNKKPDWLEKKIHETFADFYLLCNNDLEWIPDPVRENNGQMRSFLYNKYKENLETYNLDYSIISGINNERTQRAVLEVNNFLKKRDYEIFNN